MPNILNSHLAQEFLLQKPKIGYNWHAVSEFNHYKKKTIINNG